MAAGVEKSAILGQLPRASLAPEPPMGVAEAVTGPASQLTVASGLTPLLPCLPFQKKERKRETERKKEKLLSRVRLFATPWTVAHQAPLSMEFSRQEYWSGLPFPSPGDFPNPGIKSRSPALLADSLSRLQAKSLPSLSMGFSIREYWSR